MKHINKTLIKEIMELPPSEKMVLIETISETLDKPDKEINKIWLDEAQARLKKHREGKRQGIPADKVLKE